MASKRTLWMKLNDWIGADPLRREDVGTNFKSIDNEMKERSFNVKWFGAKGDGITDDTDAINRAIESAQAWKDASVNGLRAEPLNQSYRGAVVYFPAGIFNVRNLKMKSGIIYRGAGVLSTRLNPIGTNGYVFSRDDSEQWCSQIAFEKFTIAPTDEHFAFTPAYGDPPKMGGFDLTLTASAYMRKIKVLNIAGTGIHMAECYDSYFDEIEMIYVGTDVNTPAIGMYPGIAKTGGRPANIIDVTNAIHISKIRIENCPYGLVVDGTKYTNKLLREIQFHGGCKFENAPMLIRHVVGFTYTDSNINVPKDENVPAVTIGGIGADTRGVSFVNNTYFSGTTNVRWVFDVLGQSTYDLKISESSVTSVKKFLTVNGKGISNANVILPIYISGLTAVNCGTPFIQAARKLRLTRANFYQMVGDDYVVIAGDYSQIDHCDFNRISKGINVGGNCSLDKNSFSNVTVHAHYVTRVDNKIQGTTYETGVVKEVEYSEPNIALNTYISNAVVSIAPVAYKEDHIITPVGTNNQYPLNGTAAVNKWSYFTNPQVRFTGTIAGGETVVVKFEVIYGDGTTTFVEKSFTEPTYSYWLTQDELSELVITKKSIVNFKMYAKSNTSAAISLAACRVMIVANMH